MEISKLYNGLVEFGKLYQKFDNIDMQRKLLELTQEALEMQNEILLLREENDRLKEKQDIRSRIERHKDAYITLKDDEKKLIYCSNCYDTKQQLVQAQTDEDGHYVCPSCKYIGYYDKEKYEKLHESEDDITII